MARSSKPIPDGYHTVTPYLTVTDAARLIAFLRTAFGATEQHVTRRDDGSVMHADVLIGDSHIMLAEANEQWKAMQSAIYLYVPDTDTSYRSAIAAGATSVMEPADQFYGDRNAGVRDFCGNYWWLATHVEDVSGEELDRRTTETVQARAAAKI
jgi:PhnB protein